MRANLRNLGGRGADPPKRWVPGEGAIYRDVLLCVEGRPDGRQQGKPAGESRAGQEAEAAAGNQPGRGDWEARSVPDRGGGPSGEKGPCLCVCFYVLFTFVGLTRVGGTTQNSR